LSKSIFTLFASITGGISWREVSDPLFEISWVTGLSFCMYIFFTVFAMLNIITAVFLETGLAAAHQDQDTCIQEQMVSEESAVGEMLRIFKKCDTNNTGELTLEQFLEHLSKPEIVAHLASLGIEVGEAQGLFHLLDTDSSGTCSMEEFVYGCMRNKGNAKALDVQTLLHENKKMCAKMKECMADIRTDLQRLENVEGGLEHVYNMSGKTEQRLEDVLRQLCAMAFQNVEEPNTSALSQPGTVLL